MIELLYKYQEVLRNQNYTIAHKSQGNFQNDGTVARL
jgi:hypothetical protein